MVRQFEAAAIHFDSLATNASKQLHQQPLARVSFLITLWALSSGSLRVARIPSEAGTSINAERLLSRVHQQS